MTGRRIVGTLLATDIVGSTERAAELGDRDWRSLLDQHHATVRREVRRFGGVEINTAGDAFLVAFDDPETAIGSALAIRDGVRKLGLEVRSGLHMGRVEGAGREAGGIALHITARVASLAGPSEVLVSSTVRDALAGSQLTFEERGTRALKGVPGEWRLYAVSGEPFGEPSPPWRWTGRRAFAAACLALAVAAAGVLLVPRKTGRNGPGEPEPKTEAARGDLPVSADSADVTTAHSPGAAASPIKLAVLPFQILSKPEELGFLSVGAADAIITRLTGTHRLQLRPTSSILRYVNQEVEPRQMARELQVDYLLTGTLLEAGYRLRVSAQLVRGSDGVPLWGHHYDLARGDLHVLQDSIASRVAAALEVETGAAERLSRRSTADAGAYERYLRGRSRLAELTREGVFAAMAEFEEALRRDSTFAQAHAGLATAAAQISTRFAAEQEVDAWADRARLEAARALELDPDLAEAHEALAAVFRNTEYDWERTIEESDRALQLNPHLELPHYYKAGAFYHLGLMDLAEREVEAGTAINPVNRVEPQRLRGTIALLAGRYGDAESFLEEVERRTRSPSGEWYLAQALYYSGDAVRAESLLVALASESGSMLRRAQATMASFRAGAGDEATARGWLGRVEAAAYKDHHVAYALGATYAQLGEKEEARRWLARAAETGFPCYPWFDRDPLLEPLRNDAWFRGFMKNLREDWEAAAARYGG
jgi:class 3 adenylate cyclase/TolB-like protein